MDQPPSVSVIIAPRRGAVGGDDALAAFEGLGDDKAEVLGEGWEDEGVAPVPDFLELVAKGVRDNFQLQRWGIRPL